MQKAPLRIPRMLAMPFPLLIQTARVGSTFVIRIGILNTVVFPVANRTDVEGSRRFLIECGFTAARTREQAGTHRYVQGISALVTHG